MARFHPPIRAQYFVRSTNQERVSLSWTFCLLVLVSSLLTTVLVSSCKSKTCKPDTECGRNVCGDTYQNRGVHMMVTMVLVVMVVIVRMVTMVLI